MENSTHIFTVSELNATIRKMLEGTFPFISVKGGDLKSAHPLFRALLLHPQGRQRTDKECAFQTAETLSQ